MTVASSPHVDRIEVVGLVPTQSPPAQVVCHNARWGAIFLCLTPRHERLP